MIMFMFFVVYILLAGIIYVSFTRAGEYRATGHHSKSDVATTAGALALLGMMVLVFVGGKEYRNEERSIIQSSCPQYFLYPSRLQNGNIEAGFDDSPWDAMIESHEDVEVCDVTNNNCGNIPISYDGNDIIIHYEDGDQRLPNRSGARTNFFATEPPQTSSPPSP